MSTRHAPPPLIHQPALDGLRGIAILAVLAFHLGAFEPGFLGVDLFFVLSGFLITRLLLTRLDGHGRVGLSSFWAGRFRRLLPAALVTIVAIALLATIGVFSSPTLRADLGAALGYVGNWRLVLTGDDYADHFGPASPVRHFWSLAVEEQFYLVWPVVLVGAATVARRRGWSLPRLVFAIAAGLSTLSAVLLWRLYDPAMISRAYYGTDSRMFGPLIGAALAVVTAYRPRTRRPWRSAELVGAGAVVVVGLIVVGSWSVSTATYYHGGAVLFALAIAALIALAQIRPMVPLTWRPLCWIGTISYGLYLYHWPIFALLTPARTGWSDPSLSIVRLGVTFAAAAASAIWLERPIRSGRRPRRAVPLALAAATAATILAVLVVPVPAPLVDLTPIDLAAGPPAPPPPTAPGTTASIAPTSQGASNASASSPDAQPATAQIGSTDFSLPGAALLLDAATEPSTSPPLAPLRLMVIGDSVGNNIGQGLERWSATRDDVVVWNRAMVGCGFELDTEIANAPQSNPDCHRWLDRFGGFVDEFQPDVVLVLVGRGDQAPRVMPAGNGTERVGDPEFDDLMGTAYDGLLATLERGSTKIAIVTFPCMDEAWVYQGRPGPDGRRPNETNALFNRFLRRLGRPVVDLDAHVCPHGEYRSTVEGVVGARPDGLHFSDEAADALAPWLVGELRRIH